MKLKAVVDRFEEDKAVLLLGEAERAVAWPREALPDEVREGDILWVAVSVDEAATRTARAEAEALLRQILEQNSKG